MIPLSSIIVRLRWIAFHTVRKVAGPARLHQRAPLRPRAPLARWRRRNPSECRTAMPQWHCRYSMRRCSWTSRWRERPRRGSSVANGDPGQWRSLIHPRARGRAARPRGVVRGIRRAQAQRQARRRRQAVSGQASDRRRVLRPYCRRRYRCRRSSAARAAARSRIPPLRKEKWQCTVELLDCCTKLRPGTDCWSMFSRFIDPAPPQEATGLRDDGCFRDPIRHGVRSSRILMPRDNQPLKPNPADR